MSIDHSDITGPRAVDKFGKVTDAAAFGQSHLQYPDEYMKYRVSIREAERRNGLPENALRDVLDFDPNVAQGKGRHDFGAIGIAKLMPDIALRFGIKDRRDPYDSIAAAGRYMGHLLRDFGNLKRAQAAFATTEKKEAA